jgi:hypothetical protein
MMTIRHIALMGLLLLLSSPVASVAADQFAPSFPKIVYESWVKRVNAQVSAEDEVRGPTLLGESIIRTYSTSEGERKLELHLTTDGQIYDVGEFLDLGPIADTYISKSAQIIAARIIWSSLTRDEAYLRSVVASNYIIVETPFLGSKESQLLQYIRQNPSLNPSSFYLTIDEEGPVLASDAGSSRLRVRINPTLDLLLQGQSVLYRDYLVNMLTNDQGEIVAMYDEPSVFYGLNRRANTYSYKLPEIDYYKNERSFSRKNTTSHWVPTSREQLAIPEGRIASLVAHRWATVSLPTDLRYRDVLIDPAFRIELAVEGKEVERYTLSGDGGVDRLGTVVGQGLPAYYNTISARKGESEEVIVRGIWMVRHPELAFEHIFRITDTFIINSQGQYAWMKSEVRAVLAVRMDHIQQLKAPFPAPTGQPPIFRVQINRRP